MTFAAAAIGCTFFVAGYPTVIFDSFGYYTLSVLLRTKGLMGWSVDFRTYGYPLFLVLVSGARDIPPEELRLIVFGAQLTAYLTACAYVSRKLAALLESPSAGLAAYALFALNPVLLAQTTEPLSDLISAVLILLAVSLSWRLPGMSRMGGRQAFAAFLCAGAAIAVRPANAAVAIALSAVWAFRAFRFRERWFSTTCAAVAGLIPPLIPQMIINHHLSGKWNPLIVSDLYRQQRVWGMATLKYGTVVIPGRSPFLMYTNPFYAGDPGPRAFFLHHPVRYLATLALHAFAMLDYDLPFTYITDLHPWYRWPISIAGYLILYGAIAATLVGISRVIRSRRVDEVGFALLSTAAVASAYVVLYLPVAVENRFGIAVEALATPLIVLGLAGLRRGSEKRGRLLRTFTFLAPVYVLGSIVLSLWLGSKQTNPSIPSPANAAVIDPPRAMVLAPVPARVSTTPRR